MTELLDNLAHNCLSLSGFIGILLAAFGIGGAVCRALKIEHEEPLASAVWNVALGLVAGGTLLTLLGLVGLLYAPAIALATVAAALAGLYELACWLARSSHPAEQSVSSTGEKAARALLFTAALVVSIGTLLSALAPPTAGDALCYHLELPKAFLNRHAIAFLPFHDNSTFPLLGEMLYLWGLALGGATTAQLVAWGTGGLLALSAVLLARPLIGNRWAWLTGAIVLLVPGVTTHMTAPLCDLTVALWLTLALCAWQRSFDDEQATAWRIVTGIMFGAALATKYVALPFGLAFATIWAIRWFRDRSAWRGMPAALAVVLFVAILLASPWYIRAAVHRGDPLFPFLTQITSPSPSAPEAVDKTPLARTPWGVFRAPWRLTMHPEQFGGRSHQLGPLFLMLLPGLALSRRLRGLNTLLAIAALYALLWFCLRQNVRFLYPIVPVLSLACTWAIIEAGRMPALPRLLARASLVVILLIGAMLPLYRARDRWAVAVGLESRNDYLHRREVSYNAADIVNQLAGRRARVLSQDFRGYYFRGDFIRESIYRRLTNYDQAVQQPDQLSQHLKGSGFTHVVLLAADNSPVPQDDTLARLVDGELARYPDPHDSPFFPLARYEATDTDGVCWHFRLFEIR